MCLQALYINIPSPTFFISSKEISSSLALEKQYKIINSKII